MFLNLSLLAILGLASIISSKTISVDVGKNGFTFAPDTIIADVGDQIAFNIFPPHGVVEGDGFNNPCAFKPGGFFSGYSSMEQTFTIKIQDTNPLWLYCAQASHCQRGMVAVVNPLSSGPDILAAYAAAAQKTTKSSNPDALNGGVSDSNSSSSAASSSAPSPTSTSASESPGLKSFAVMAAVEDGAADQQDPPPDGEIDKTDTNDDAKDTRMKVGVGTGFGVAIVATLIYLWCIYRRRKRRSKDRGDGPSTTR